MQDALRWMPRASCYFKKQRAVMDMPLPEGLLEAVRNYLDITWEDPAGDEKLSSIIARGIRYLDKTTGAELDYTVEDKPRELLLDYCRYVRSNALNEFAINYQHELLSLQISQEVKDYEAANPDI
jgi:hypothetical protein